MSSSLIEIVLLKLLTKIYLYAEAINDDLKTFPTLHSPNLIQRICALLRLSVCVAVSKTLIGS
jgi:hypothetical protein